MELCSIESCKRPLRAKKLCTTHYARLQTGKDLNEPIKQAGGTCVIEGCDRPRLFRQPDYCRLHYRRWHKTGDPGPAERLRGPDGEGTITNGYRMLRINGRLISEHRLVMEQALDRPLERGEHVHHINGDKLDNRLDNLELWCRHHPRGMRVADLVSLVVKRYPEQLRDALAI